MIIMDSHLKKNLFTSEEGKNREKTRKEWNEVLIFYQENITFSRRKERILQLSNLFRWMRNIKIQTREILFVNIKSETKIGFQEKKIEIEGNPTLCEISCWFLDRFHNIIVIKKLNKLANWASSRYSQWVTWLIV